ncbi:MAG TPA: collagen-like protein [Solirubrobacteraceae bacterium]|nr:collagen-like protein [Solirubrobacteraceae bacterium]
MRRHLTYANVVATLALVFAMTGGAIAAKHYLINSTKQINPKVIKKLEGHTGKTGATGLPGKQGAQGVPGTAGVEGKQGPIGPSNAYTAFNEGFVEVKFPESVTVDSVAVPPGSYVVTAKVEAIDQTLKRTIVECELVNDVNESHDDGDATIEPIGTTEYNGRAVVTLLAASTLATSGHWELNCGSGSTPEKIKLVEAQLSAQQVGSLSRVEQ